MQQPENTHTGPTSSEKKRVPKCGELKHVKVGTMSQERLYVRRCRSCRGRELVVGSRVEIKRSRERFDQWQGPLRIWKVSDDGLLYLEWM